ncbi:MAG: hypothetical protein ACOYL8_03570 [Patescibacteria group bacterium]
MNKKEKKQLWRIPLFFTLFIAIIYQLVSLFHGSIPDLSQVRFLENSGQYSYIPYFEIPLPFMISRWLDIVFVFIFVMLVVKNWQNRQEGDNFGEPFSGFVAFCFVGSLVAYFIAGILFCITFPLCLGLITALLYSANLKIRMALIVGLMTIPIYGFIQAILATALFLLVCFVVYLLYGFFKSNWLARFFSWLRAEEKQFEMHISESGQKKIEELSNSVDEKKEYQLNKKTS